MISRKLRSSVAILALLATPGHTFVTPTVAAQRNNNYPNYASNGDTVADSGGLNSLSVTELKRLLSERGVDFRDCLEKRNLVERLQNSQASRNRQASVPLIGLSDQEQSLISTFKRVSPSVANIKTTTLVPQLRGLQLRGLEVPAGSGSGFLWDGKGHVVTNFHVVASGRRDGSLPSSVKVKLAGISEALDAEVVGVEPEKDLAVLKVRNFRKLPRPIDVGTSNDLQVGQSVMAIGNPFGLDDTLTTGVVSALGRDVDGIGGRPIHGCIQTDAAINPGKSSKIFHQDYSFESRLTDFVFIGNSGGPLLDSRGRLIGVNTAIFSPGGRPGNIGIGFAIPVDTVRRVVNQIILYGKVVRPTLGISIVDDRLVRSIEGQLGRPLDGCLVAKVVPNSPAGVAGLEASIMGGDGSIILGDLVTEVNGELVRQAEDLISAIEEKSEGDTVTLRVLRKCDPRKAENVRVTLTTRDKLQNNGTRPSSSRPANRRSRSVEQQPSIWQ
jgi:S1-C subfamily serine protease